MRLLGLFSPVLVSHFWSNRKKTAHYPNQKAHNPIWVIYAQVGNQWCGFGELHVLCRLVGSVTVCWFCWACIEFRYSEAEITEKVSAYRRMLMDNLESMLADTGGLSIEKDDTGRPVYVSGRCFASQIFFCSSFLETFRVRWTQRIFWNLVVLDIQFRLSGYPAIFSNPVLAPVPAKMEPGTRYLSQIVIGPFLAVSSTIESAAGNHYWASSTTALW